MMIKHRLRKFADENNMTMGSIAKASGISRTQLYRIMDGENTTMERLRLISAATGGKVSIADLIEASSPEGERA